MIFIHDTDLGRDVMSFTPSEAIWLSHLLQTHLISEFALQLRLAAFSANSPTVVLEQKFELKRS